MTDIKKIEKDILAGVEQMNEEFQAIRLEFQKKAQEKIKEAFKAVLQDFPDLNIVWTQYTPAWNDGEECTFRVSDVYLTNVAGAYLQQVMEENGSLELEEEYDDIFTGYGDFVPSTEPGAKSWQSTEVYDESHWNRPYFWVSASNTEIRSGGVDRRPAFFRDVDTTKLQNLLKLVRIIQQTDFEETMEATFGNGVRVVANINGFEIDEYDCGH